MRKLKLLEVFTRAAKIMEWVIVDAVAASEVIVDAVGVLAAEVCDTSVKIMTWLTVDAVGGLAAEVGVVGSVVA